MNAFERNKINMTMEDYERDCLRKENEADALDRIRSEEPGEYVPDDSPFTDDWVLQRAREIAAERLSSGELLSSPGAATRYIEPLIREREAEVFCVLWLSTRHGVLAWEEMFHGTIDGASVYPREVVKAGLAHNAAACILAHNHPSGDPEPSQADIRITERLKKALAMVDIRILDHLVCGAATTVSMAERGLI